MSALITSVEHALATAASDTVKVAKFVETSVLPVLKKAQAGQSTIEAVTALVSPQAANIERVGSGLRGQNAPVGGTSLVTPLNRPMSGPPKRDGLPESPSSKPQAPRTPIR
jgi:hypothetical protein